MAKRAGQCYYNILQTIMKDFNHGKLHPIFTTFIKKYGQNIPTLGKILLRYFCLEGNVDIALRLIHEFHPNNLKLNFPVDVIKILKEQGKPLKAFNLIMGAQIDLSIIDVVDYSILVDGLCKEGYVDKALELCNFAREKGIVLNIVTYNSLFNGLCRQGCLIEAFRLFDALEKNNVFPSEITYGTLIVALVREGFLLDARKLFNRMLVKNTKPNTHIYNSLIDGYCKYGNVKEALRLFRDLEKNSLRPDKFTISALIFGFYSEGNMEEALKFFTEMKENGFSPDFLGFLYLVRGMCTKGRMEEARDVLKEMIRDDSVIDLINRVNVEVEMESIEKLLIDLCEQGNIQDSLVILNEIGSMFFPCKRDSNSSGQNVSVHLEEEKECKVEFNDMYSKMASLCSDGNVQAAADVAKALISRGAKD